MKCVIIINSELEMGLIANAAAVLGISLSREIDEILGEDIKDADGRVHKGITRLPIPILQMTGEALREKYDSVLESADEEIKVIAFNDVAQKSLAYEDYREKLSKKRSDSIKYLGICLCGPKKKINRLTGNLKMLR